MYFAGSNEAGAVDMNQRNRAPSYGLLLGVLRGHWNLENRSDPLAFGEEDLAAVNMGIAIVTPIQDALDIINGDELVERRKRLDRVEAKRFPPGREG